MPWSLDAVVGSDSNTSESLHTYISDMGTVTDRYAVSRYGTYRAVRPHSDGQPQTGDRRASGTSRLAYRSDSLHSYPTGAHGKPHAMEVNMIASKGPADGARVLIRTLVESGATTVANPGTTELHMVEAAEATPGLRSVLALFEGVVSGAADG